MLDIDKFSYISLSCFICYKRIKYEKRVLALLMALSLAYLRSFRCTFIYVFGAIYYRFTEIYSHLLTAKWNCLYIVQIESSNILIAAAPYRVGGTFRNTYNIVFQTVLHEFNE